MKFNRWDPRPSEPHRNIVQLFCTTLSTSPINPEHPESLTVLTIVHPCMLLGGLSPLSSARSSVFTVIVAVVTMTVLFSDGKNDAADWNEGRRNDRQGSIAQADTSGRSCLTFSEKRIRVFHHAW